MPSPPAQAAALQAYGLSEQLWGMQPTRIDATEFIRTIAESFDECIKQEREARVDAPNDVRKMLADAERKFQDAAAMHSMGKVSYYSGQIAALKAVLKVV
jgi:hypothetical protein